jgi:hypothetical protein
MMKMKFTDGQSEFDSIEFRPFGVNCPIMVGNKYLIKGNIEKIEVRRNIMLLTPSNI